jgi:hypothetical protein
LLELIIKENLKGQRKYIFQIKIIIFVKKIIPTW